MPDQLIFQIRPLSMTDGFELACEGIMDRPLRVERLFEAVVLATQLGQDLNFEIQIFDVDGQKADVIELNRDSVFATQMQKTKAPPLASLPGFAW